MLDLNLYAGLLVFVMLGVAFIVGLFIANFLFRETGKDAEGKTIYECGMAPIGSAYVSPNIRFYIFALIFVIFDVEVVFVLPWAVKFKELGVPGLAAMGIFLGILTLGFIYEWKKGALKWE